MDDYIVIDHIGEGSFGKVYKARRKGTGFIVAMKFITKHGKAEKDIRNLRQEISILRNLNHKNIILMYDAFETDREFCVVTEFGQGELFDILKDDQKLPESTIQQIAKQLVEALQYLHSHRIIHRDMKPQNVLIGANGVVKLCDFGFAREMSSKTIVLTSIKGTPLYMSPELMKEQAYDATSDLWSLGVILYELFVGTPPFYTNNIYSLMSHIVKDPVKYPPEMSKDFKSFLQGLLQKNPSKRLTWPHLSEHPFVKITEQDREKRREEVSFYSTCGGAGGPRARLNAFIVSNATKTNLFGTMNIRDRDVIGNMEGLPHERILRERRSQRERTRQELVEKQKEKKRDELIAEQDRQWRVNQEKEESLTMLRRIEEEDELGDDDHEGIKSPRKLSTRAVDVDEKNKFMSPPPKSSSTALLRNVIGTGSITVASMGVTTPSRSSSSPNMNVSKAANSAPGKKSPSKASPGKTREDSKISSPTKGGNAKAKAAVVITIAKTPSRPMDDGLIDETKPEYTTPASVSKTTIEKDEVNEFRFDLNRSKPQDDVIIDDGDELVIEENDRQNYTFTSSSSTPPTVDEEEALKRGRSSSSALSSIEDNVAIERDVSRVHEDDVTELLEDDEDDISSLQEEARYWQQLYSTGRKIAHEAFHRVSSFVASSPQMDLLLITSTPTFAAKLDEVFGLVADIEEDLTSTRKSSQKSTVLFDIVHHCFLVCTLAIETSLSIVNDCTEDEKTSTVMTHKLVPALRTCSNICQDIPGICSFLSKLFKGSINKNNGSVDWLDIIVCALSFLSLLVNIPSDDEFRKSNLVGDVIDSLASTGSLRMNGGRLVSSVGISTSDRWSIITWMTEALRIVIGTDSVPSATLRLKLTLPLLSAIKTIVEGSKPDTYEIIVVQQVPMLLPSLLGYRPALASIIQILVTMLTPRGKPWLISSLLSDNENDGKVSMPLEFILKGSDSKQWSAFHEVVGARISLRNRVCSMITDEMSKAQEEVYGLDGDDNIFGLLVDSFVDLSSLPSLNDEGLHRLRDLIELLGCLCDCRSVTSSSSKEHVFDNVWLFFASPRAHDLMDLLHKALSLSRPASPIISTLKVAITALLNRMIHTVFSLHELMKEKKGRSMTQIPSEQLKNQLINIIRQTAMTSTSVDEPSLTASSSTLLATIASYVNLTDADVSDSPSNYHSEVDDRRERLGSRIMTRDDIRQVMAIICKNITSQEYLQSLQDLIEFPSRIAHLSQGDFGYKSSGVLDGALKLINIVTNAYPSILRLNEARSLAGMISRLIRSTTSGGLVSPDGSLHGLEFIRSFLLTNSQVSTPLRDDKSAASSQARSTLEFAKMEEVIGLVSIIALPQHVEYCQLWLVMMDSSLVSSPTRSPEDATFSRGANISPVARDPVDVGRQSFVSRLILAVGLVLKTLIMSINILPESKDSQHVLEGICRTQLIKFLVQSFKSHGGSLTLATISTVAHVLCELILTSSKFVAQFVDCRGLEAIHNHIANHASVTQSGSNHNETLVSTLLIASHLSRHSDAYYDLLAKIYTLPYFAFVITHPDTTVRGKCCNLLGNLFKHSDRFYNVVGAPLPQTGSGSRTAPAVTVMHHLISCLSDPDSNARKFACFAVGNAAFHSDQLYNLLSLAVVPLGKCLLEQSDEKTRANAAGAIGNLVRNSGSLAPKLAQEKIPQKLMKIIAYDDDVSVKRIAMFSLGTMALFQSCKEAIMTAASRDCPSIQEINKLVKTRHADDDTMMKYLDRLKVKIKSTPPS